MVTTAAAQQDFRVLAKFPIPSFEMGEGITLNAALNLVYVSAGFNTGDVFVFDGNTLKRTAAVAGSGASVDSKTDNYWAGLLYSGGVAIYSGSTNERIGLLPSVKPYCPGAVTFDCERRRMWVATQCGSGNDPVFVYDADTFALIDGPIFTGNIVQGSEEVVNPNTGRYYILDYTSGGTGGPLRIDPTTFKVTPAAFGTTLAVNSVTGILLAAFLLGGNVAFAYGPLNHLCIAEENWDPTWKLIEAVDPGRNAVYIRQTFFAGAMADDLGYYPVPAASRDVLKLLTDSMHYAKTGEFVARQLRDAAAAHDGVLFAFALGELSHYAADRMGHYYGTNAVAVQVARKEEMYGSRMSYERDEPLHFVVESGFDVIAVSKQCSPDTIGEIARSLPRGKAWESAGKVVEFLNAEYQKSFGTRLELKEEFFVQALLFSDYIFTQTAHDAEIFYRIGTPIDVGHKSQDTTDGFDWIVERVRGGVAFAKAYGSSKADIFGDSFMRAHDLYANLLNGVTILRKDKSPLELSGVAFEDINLDTNMLSVSGEYSLADRTHEHILGYEQPGTKINCPPKATLFDAYFDSGRRIRRFLLRLAWDVTLGPSLNQALDEISRLFTHDQEVTLSERIPIPDLSVVHFTKCPPDGTCVGKVKAVFLPGASVGVERGVVNFTAESTLLDVWMGALAASRLKGVDSAPSRDQVLRQVGQWRLEVVEEHRLEDSAADDGYYGWPEFCLNPPYIGPVVH
jgi:hypothetical protein